MFVVMPALSRKSLQQHDARVERSTAVVSRVYGTIEMFVSGRVRASSRDGLRLGCVSNPPFSLLLVNEHYPLHIGRDHSCVRRWRGFKPIVPGTGESLW